MNDPLSFLGFSTTPLELISFVDFVDRPFTVTNRS